MLIYDWLHRSPTAREQADAELAPVIQEIFTKSRATYGNDALGNRY
ncbi:MAG: hypothetical protein IPN42_18250 [Methylococcaceae bacterium]|nr:hypothetical protein [Methylococcaceae bacterium]